MHTLQLGDGWFPEQANGRNQVFFSLIRHLPAAGVGVRGLVAGSAEVEIQTQGEVTAFASAEASLPVRWWQARQAGKRLLARHQPSLVAAHVALYAAPLIRALGDVPLVVHFHGPWASENRMKAAGRRLAEGLKVRLERSVYGQAERCIVLSEAFGEVLHRGYAVPWSRIRTVPGGVDAARFAIKASRTEARERLHWPLDRPVILSVRHLRKRIGLENLIDAMQTVRRVLPEAFLVIAGEGPMAEVLQARIEASGLEQHVRLLGFVPEAALPWVYRAADLSIVPTVALEGFSLVAIESLAAGTPVLVTPVGGLPEAVRGLSDTLVLPGLGRDVLADSLIAALQGRLPLPSAAACRRYAQQTFDWPVIARRVRGVYEEVVS